MLRLTGETTELYGYGLSDIMKQLEFNASTNFGDVIKKLSEGGPRDETN